MNTNRNHLRIFLLCAIFCVLGMHSCSPDAEVLDTNRLAEAFEQFREPSLTQRRFGYATIAPLIESRSSLFENQILGNSVEGRPIHALTYGDGTRPVLLWSQMHGDESTATMALFDLFNFLEGSETDAFEDIRQKIRNELQIRFIPMVNPDGAERFQRRNALHIDLNRDAIRQSSPEAVVLKNARDAFEPEFGFNLHDQNSYYNVSGTTNPATISVLAPAYNEAREMNPGREKAMKVIAGMNRVLQEEIPDHLGKYNDSFEPRAFGDNFQKWGTSTILIESGAFPDDPEKQYVRKLNFMIILNALYEIAAGTYETFPVDDYLAIPDNSSRLMDLIVRNVSVTTAGHSYVTDIGVRRAARYAEERRYFQGTVSDWGDLSVYHGYKELDATGLEATAGKVWEEEKPLEELNREEAFHLLREGYLGVKTSTENKGKLHELPLLLLTGEELPDLEPSLANAPNFFLVREGEYRYAVVNGYLIDLQNPGSEAFWHPVN